MFDKRYDDDDFDTRGDGSEEGPSALTQIQGILTGSKISFDLDSDKDYDTILILDNGVQFLFDEEGTLAGVENNYDKKD